MFNKLKEKFKNRKCKTGSCENKNKPVAKSEFDNKKVMFSNLCNLQK